MSLRVEALTAQYLHQSGRTSGSFTLDAQEVANGLLYTLEAHFRTASIEQYHLDVPLNAWQHLKRDFAPAWFKRLFPVKFQRHHLSVKAIYRGLPVRHGQPVITVEEHNELFVDA